MANLVSAAEVQVLVGTSVSSANLDTIIEREEQAIIDMYGAHYVDVNTAISETHVREVGAPAGDIFLRRPILSMDSLTEKVDWTSTAVALTENVDYVTVPGQGRLVRLNQAWGRVATVAYVPQDDRLKRKRAIIEMVRLALARTAMRSENIAGEYSYTVAGGNDADLPWERERAKILASLGFARP